MLYIDRLQPHVQFALDEHYRNIKCLVWKKIGAKDTGGVRRTCGNQNCDICNSKIEEINNIPNKIYDFLNDETLLEIIVTGKPQDLQVIDEEFWNFIHPGFKYHDWINIVGTKDKKLNSDEKIYKAFIQGVFSILNKIFAYDTWFVANKPTHNYSAYHLATYLNIRSCVYCNRTYIVSQFKQESPGKIGKLIRPQFDHWFAQEKYPLLALSFYNLIPSCGICNSSVKGRKHYSLSKYLHPYEDDVLNSITFSYRHTLSIDSIKIELVGVNNDPDLENRINNTLKDFHLEEMYDSHQPELRDLLIMKKNYSENYIKILKGAFPDANLTDVEVYRLIFGVEVESENFHKRPFSKFKSDILRELGIIR